MSFANALLFCALLSMTYKQPEAKKSVDVVFSQHLAISTCLDPRKLCCSILPLEASFLIATASHSLGGIYSCFVVSFGRVRHEPSGSHWNYFRIGSHLLVRHHWGPPGPHARPPKLQIPPRPRGSPS